MLPVSVAGKYHPALDSSTNIFLIEAIFKMSNLSGAQVLRFQRPQINYDNENVYLTATLVEQTDTLCKPTPCLLITDRLSLLMRC